MLGIMGNHVLNRAHIIHHCTAQLTVVISANLGLTTEWCILYKSGNRLLYTAHLALQQIVVYCTPSFTTDCCILHT